MLSVTLVRAAAVLSLVAPCVGAQQSRITNLARASQNPLSPLINVPLQNNFNFGTGVPGRTQYVLNLQPVIPVALSRDYSLVSRMILPTVHHPLGKDDSEVGLGDATVELLVANAKPIGENGITAGIGPAFIFPTATDPVLGMERWAAGAAGVLVVTPEPWVAGVLAEQQWSFAGAHDRRSIAPFTLQPFVNYNLSDGWAIMSAPIITADWMSPDDDWFVPVGGGVSRTVAGPQPATMSVQGYYNALRHRMGPDWDLRVTISLLFPSR